MESVGKHYNKPAILLRERLSRREVWCVVPQEIEQEVAREATFVDLWQDKRVTVFGLLSYNDAGDLARVDATELHRADVPEVDIDLLKDKGFTGDLSVNEYLDRLSEGDLD